MFETQKSGNKTGSREIGLNITTLARSMPDGGPRKSMSKKVDTLSEWVKSTADGLKRRFR